jgi:hypothetical protein
MVIRCGMWLLLFTKTLVLTFLITVVLWDEFLRNGRGIASFESFTRGVDICPHLSRVDYGNRDALLFRNPSEK